MHRVDQAKTGTVTQCQFEDYLARIGCCDMLALSGLIRYPLTFTTMAQLLPASCQSLNKLSENEEASLWREVLTFEELREKVRQKLGGFCMGEGAIAEIRKKLAPKVNSLSMKEINLIIQK